MTKVGSNHSDILGTRIGARGSLISQQDIEYFGTRLEASIKNNKTKEFVRLVKMVSAGEYSVLKAYLKKNPQMKDQMVDYIKAHHHKIERSDLKLILKKITGSDAVVAMVDEKKLGKPTQSKNTLPLYEVTTPNIKVIPEKFMKMMNAGNLIYDKNGNKFDELTPQEFTDFSKMMGEKEMLKLLAGSPSTWPLLHLAEKHSITGDEQIFFLYLLAHRATIIEKINKEDSASYEVSMKISPKMIDEIMNELSKKSLPDFNNINSDQKQKLNNLLKEYVKQYSNVVGQ